MGSVGRLDAFGFTGFRQGFGIIAQDFTTAFNKVIRIFVTHVCKLHEHRTRRIHRAQGSHSFPAQEYITSPLSSHLNQKRHRLFQQVFLYRNRAVSISCPEITNRFNQILLLILVLRVASCLNQWSQIAFRHNMSRGNCLLYLILYVTCGNSRDCGCDQKHDCYCPNFQTHHSLPPFGGQKTPTLWINFCAVC